MTRIDVSSFALQANAATPEMTRIDVSSFALQANAATPAIAASGNTGDDDGTHADINISFRKRKGA